MFVTSPPQDVILLQPCSYFIADWKLHPYTSGIFPGGYFSHFMSVQCGNQLTKRWTFYKPLFFWWKACHEEAGSVRSTLLFNFCEWRPSRAYDLFGRLESTTPPIGESHPPGTNRSIYLGSQTSHRFKKNRGLGLTITRQHCAIHIGPSGCYSIWFNWDPSHKKSKRGKSKEICT